MKTVRSVYVDGELWKKAQEKGINISQEVDRLLRQLVGSEPTKPKNLRYDNVVPGWGETTWQWLEMCKGKYLRWKGEEPLTPEEEKLVNYAVEKGLYKPHLWRQKWLKSLYRELERKGINGMDFRAWVAAKLNPEEMELRWLRRLKSTK